MKPLIGYIRCSTSGQLDGFGLKVQEDSIKQYAKHHSFNLIKIFRDGGFSGALKDRPALAELLDYATKNKNLNLTLVFVRLDRLSRSLLLQENLITDFQKRGLTIISIDEPDLCSSDPTRVLFRQIKGALAQHEKAMITLRMSSGRLAKVKEGLGYAGGNVAYGFRAKNGKYEQIKEEVDVVREIFRLRRKPKYGRRISYQKIADKLNIRGVLPPQGVKWYAMTVRLIFLNKFYRGYQRYGTVEILNKTIRV